MQLALLGRQVHADGADDELTGWLDRNWNFPETAGALQSDFVIELTRGWAGSDADVVLRGESGEVTVSLGSKRALVGLSGGAFSEWNLLYSGLAEALMASGLFLLHTAVVARGTNALALCAPSGGGKTTSAVIAAAAGWSLVSEDHAWLEPKSLEVFGADRQVRIRPPVIGLVSELHRQFDPGLRRGPKYEVPYETFSDRRWSANLTHVVDLRKDLNAESAWSELSKSGVVMTLMRASGAPHAETTRSQFGPLLADIAHRVKGRRLLIGSTPLPFDQLADP